MCDCYGHGCSEEGCEKVIPMHLGNYDTARAEIEVYCHEHMSAVYGWTGIEENSRVYAYLTFKKSRLRRDENGELFQIPRPDKIEVCAVRDLTPNAVENRDINHPNAGTFTIVEEM